MKYTELLTLYNNSKNQILFWRTKEIDMEHMPKAIQLNLQQMYDLYKELTEDERFRLHRPGVFDDELAEEFAYKLNEEKHVRVSPQEAKEYKNHLKKAHKEENVNGNPRIGAVVTKQNRNENR